jgi:TetR/AcrR family transcriptional regulator, regulator of cefoperazone and chloramphenicol sensitivity
MVTKKIPPKDRRKELILAAFDHIANRGFEGLRVHDVAAQVGINNATLHYYFPSKEDLIKGVVDYMIEKFSTSYVVGSAGEEAPNAWKEMLGELEDARHNFRDARDRLVVFIELFIRSLRDPAIAKIFKKLDENWRGYLVGLIERGIRQGVFRAELDSEVTATMVMIQIKGFGFQMLGESDPAIADKVFDQLVLQVESWLSTEFRK